MTATMRELTFGRCDAGKTYIILYQSLVFSPGPIERSELKAHGSMLTKMEAVGEQANIEETVEKGAFPLYRCETGGSVLFDEAEYALIKRLAVAYVPKVHKALSRELDATLDWLDAIPAVPVEKKQKKDALTTEQRIAE